MNEAKHTPGPWGVRNNAHVMAGGNTIATIKGEFGDPANSANVRLMASSPELLAVCQKVDQFLDHLKNSWEVCHHTQAMMDQIKAAIAKATGSQA